MKRLLLALAFLSLVTPVWAQNPTCPTRPAGDSSNACASTAFVSTGGGAGPAPASRIQLSAPLTLFVNPSSSTAALCNGASGGAGNDSTGSGTLAAPFLTPNKALDTAARNYDVRLAQITIQYCDNNITTATYGQFQMVENLVGATSAGGATQAQLIVQGNSSTPANVIVQGSSGTAAFGFVGVTSPVTIKDMQIGSTLIGGATTGHGISADARSLVYYANITWGFIATSHAHINGVFGSFIEQEGVERINGGAALHWNADRGTSILTTGNTITCTGTPAFPSAFIALTNESNFLLNSAAFSGCGAVTGPHYIADLTSSFGSGSPDPNTIFPGNSNGSVTIPSFNLTGLLVSNGGGPTGATNPVTSMPAMNGDCTISLTSGAITCTKTNNVAFATSATTDTTNATNITTGTLAVARGGTDQTAWTVFTPSPSCGTATFTVNSARSKTIGKTTFVQGDFTITAIGTCALTNVTFNLPNTAQSVGNLTGREGAITNKGFNCSIAASATQANCLMSDDATAWVVNDRLQFSGIYENQ